MAQPKLAQPKLAQQKLLETHPLFEEELRSHYLHSIVAQSPNDRRFEHFCKLLLETYPLKKIREADVNELRDFLISRYTFLKEALNSESLVRVSPLPPSHDTVVLDLVSPALEGLIDTVKWTLASLGANIDHLGYREFYVNESDLRASLPAKEQSYRKVMVFFCRCIKKEDEHFSTHLEAKVKERLEILRSITKSQNAIQEKWTELEKFAYSNSDSNSDSTLGSNTSSKQWAELLVWLAQGNFHPLGYLPVPFDKNDRPNPLQGLGLLSPQLVIDEVQELRKILHTTAWLESANHEPSLDLISAVNPVGRGEKLLRLTILGKNGEEKIQHNFVGVFRPKAHWCDNAEIPILREKRNQILTADIHHSDDEKHEIDRLLARLPKFYLFRTSTESLTQIVRHMISAAEPNRLTSLALNHQSLPRLDLLVSIPNSLLNHNNTQKVVDYFKREIPTTDLQLFEIKETDRLHLFICCDLSVDPRWKPNVPEYERELATLLQSWEQQVEAIAQERYSKELAQKYCSIYLPAFPPHYRSRTTPDQATSDMHYLDQVVHDMNIQCDLKPFELSGSELSQKATLLYIYSRQKIDLATMMPVLQLMGLYVFDGLTARIGFNGKTYGYVQSFRIQDSKGQCLDTDRHHELISDLLKAIMGEQTENDPLNALAITAGLSWRFINVVILYRNLLVQMGCRYKANEINKVLLNHTEEVQLLVEYFATKFSPDGKFGDREYRSEFLLPPIKSRFFDRLRSIKEVSTDTILRRLFDLLDKSLRTNFYIPRPQTDTLISVKIDSQKIEESPTPRPKVEIYVHDVGVEGIHLRFGSVARGGIRWSDRLEDFRTEVLGLVKTQQSKNVVIVPVGSKGGFAIKKFDSPQEEAKRQYKRFVRGLLDITDNLDSQAQARHPAYVVCYDDLDPYLVIAADKGTATYSDMANAISHDYKFWLDDAFASGGSYGYDHKKVAITARGAWECTKLHFRELERELNRDLNQTFTATGVGDMSGDVFGNGMLLSTTMSLKAAFNHVHIFLDPNPDPLKSWDERKRLFHLPRSTWRDYNTSLISQGGGVFDRKAKEIPLSEEVRMMLGTESSVLTGEQVISRILQMEVDLLWLGGIGTYIKADQETHMQVGDEANNDVRINASQVKAHVIAEGANLGITQRGRQQLDEKGIHLNTDAIDNSAGVNMSDYEVNIKILLKELMRKGEISSMEERNEILVAATEEVAHLVMNNNREQHQLISMDKMRSQEDFKTFKLFVRDLIVHRGLDDQSEAIPTRDQFEKMDIAQTPMPRPILATLQAYTKMWVYTSLLNSQLPDDPHLEHYYASYFPKLITARFRNSFRSHPLRREIIATVLTNHIVNRAGMTFFYRHQLSSARSPADIAKAYLLIEECVEAERYRQAIHGASDLTQTSKYQLLIELERHLQNMVAFVLRSTDKALDFGDIHRYQEIFKELKNYISQNPDACDISTQIWVDKGCDQLLAERLCLLQFWRYIPDVMHIHEKEHQDVSFSIECALAVDRCFHISRINQMIHATSLQDEWQLAHRNVLLENIEKFKFELINQLAPEHRKSQLKNITQAAFLAPLKECCQLQLKSFFDTLKLVEASAQPNLTSLSVLVARLEICRKE